METMLTCQELASLMGISYRHAKRLAETGEIKADRTLNANNRPKYLIPLSSLDAPLQDKYLKQHRPTAPPPAPKVEAKPLDTYSGAEAARRSRTGGGWWPSGRSTAASREPTRRRWMSNISCYTTCSTPARSSPRISYTVSGGRPGGRPQRPDRQARQVAQGPEQHQRDRLAGVSELLAG